MRPHLAMAIAFGVTGCTNALNEPDASIPRDLTMRPVDAAVAPPDLSAPIPDMSVPQDLADLWMCGGYHNSDADTSCPLLCSPDVSAVPDEGRFHVDYCTPVVYMHNPPASGNHWPWHADWGVHDEVVPRESWVHNLEHGGVVLLYNCPTFGVGATPLCFESGNPPPSDKGCSTEIARFAQFYAQTPPVNFWDLEMVTLIVVTSDPLLPKKFAAVAWDWVWMADTLDANAVQCFIDARYGRGPEFAP